jgi:SAM-dependent methyltransferase
MPTLSQNLDRWDRHYHWDDGGDEWSRPWGGPAGQWQHVLLPRIADRLPVDTVLEIGPGYGRWSHFLKDQCRRLVLVDLSPRCIEACRARFGEDPRIDYVVNDGASLSPVEDRSVDFIFSFDTLVHAERDVMLAYLREFQRVLRPGGAAFVHHSNLAAYREWLLQNRPLEVLDHWRGVTVSAAFVRHACDAVGLRCPRQELINWRDVGVLLDCFSTIVLDAAAEASTETAAGDDAAAQARRRDCDVITNMTFMQDSIELARGSSRLSTPDEVDEQGRGRGRVRLEEEVSGVEDVGLHPRQLPHP